MFVRAAILNMIPLLRATTAGVSNAAIDPDVSRETPAAQLRRLTRRRSRKTSNYLVQHRSRPVGRCPQENASFCGAARIRERSRLQIRILRSIMHVALQCASASAAIVTPHVVGNYCERAGMHTGLQWHSTAAWVVQSTVLRTGDWRAPSPPVNIFWLLPARRADAL